MLLVSLTLLQLTEKIPQNLHSVKLTVHTCKMVVETTFLLGRPIFRGYVSFSPGNPFMNRPWFDNRKDHWFFEDHFHTMPILNLRICPTPEVMDRRHHTCLQHALQNHESWCWNQMTTIKSSINFTTKKETKMSTCHPSLLPRCHIFTQHFIRFSAQLSSLPG